MDLNIITFIFFALAVVVFIQLRNVLGRRTGNERPPFDPYSRAEAGNEAKAEAEPGKTAAELNPFAAIDAYAPAGSALNEDLRAVARADSAFVLPDFLAGARAAYEMILAAFAEGDRAALQKLLAKEVYKDFAAAIDARAAAGETVKFSFVGLEKADIAAARLSGREAQISLSFKGEVISATYDKAGKLIEGDAQTIIPLNDRWSFVRNIDSKSPDWLLAATQDEDE